MDSVLRNLPKIDVLVEYSAKQVPQDFSVRVLTDCCRRVIERLRSAILSGEMCVVPSILEISKLVMDEINAENQLSLRPVINATGVVIHTNLGRAVLSETVAENVKRIASSYSTLEYSLQTGERGSRHSHVESLICRITGAEAAMAVGNNAAAIMLALMAICNGKEVVVSRGELVEIGGSFRVPEIMSLSGCMLREVGTTNKTKPNDYERAIGQNTAALLKVHTSNFRVVGFTQSVQINQLSELSKAHQIPLIYDLGSGLMLEGQLSELGENSVSSSLRDGADVVCFSGDKLFGGPQAGIIAGKKELIAAMKSHPLARVVRIDKLTLAALEATLKIYLDPKRAVDDIPVLASLSISQEQLEHKAKKLMQRLSSNSGHLCIAIKKSQGQVGGGSAPGECLDSFVIEITSTQKSTQAIERELRESPTPIIARINKGAVLLDVRTIRESEFETIAAALTSINKETDSI